VATVYAPTVTAEDSASHFQRVSPTLTLKGVQGCPASAYDSLTTGPPQA
jgi:hypothetical protein